MSHTSQTPLGFEPSPLPPIVSRLAEFFVSRGIDAYLVGGAVRDTLLGVPVNDIDLAVATDAGRIGADLAAFLGGHVVRLRHDWDVVRVALPGDAEPSIVDLSGVSGTVEADLARRDFSVNTMALPLTATQNPWEHLIDPHGGLNDLRAGVVRVVSPAAFDSDPARLLRAPRLAAQLGFEIHDGTAAEIQRRSGLVTYVAPERIRDELMKLLSYPGGTGRLRLLDSLDLLREVIPELEQARGCTQPKEHYYDVFGHLLETAGFVDRMLSIGGEPDDVVSGAMPRFEGMDEYFAERVTDGYTRLTLLKLAGLLHDVGKPAARTVETSGRIRFLGHHEVGAEMATVVMKRLRFSRRGVQLMELMVRHHLRPAQLGPADTVPSGKAVYKYFRDLGPAAADTVYLNMADYLAAKGPSLDPSEWYERCAITESILRRGLEQKAPQGLPNLVDGHDIMDGLSLPPGPHVGVLLNIAREAQANGDVHTKKEALDYLKANASEADMTLGGSGA